MDWLDGLWPRERIGFFEGQASAFYNVSAIERDYFEMWYFDNLGAYKAAAHGNPEGVEAGHKALSEALQRIAARAGRLRARAGEEGAAADPSIGKLWMTGRYTDYNREHN
jgi:hydroxylamine dehydrogenase